MGCLLKGNRGLYSRMTIGAVLLAAGAGSRLGGRPKALLELGGVPLILRQLVALSGAGVDEVAVVLGHHADAIEAAVRPFPITLARNPAPDDGQAGSVRVGLQALSPALDAVIVALADQPLIDAQDITALIGAFKKRGEAAMVVPSVRDPAGANVPGNPIIFDAALRDAWLGGAADLACRRWRAANPDKVGWFETDNTRYRIDIDAPQDLDRFAELTGHRLAWPPAWTAAKSG
ncbi:MAG TPA: nucleotidyltransferase family protein [Burkholderiaceae bacterium]|nr:nucleotidyltransferase family protein [Burkholderiaceae bacterium]